MILYGDVLRPRSILPRLVFVGHRVAVPKPEVNVACAGRPPEEVRTTCWDRGAKDHRSPSQSSKMVLSTVHVGGPKPRVGGNSAVNGGDKVYLVDGSNAG